jgi:membrane fusion protein (multidrug efflux system)
MANPGREKILRAYIVAIGLLTLILGGTALYIQQRSAGFAAGGFSQPPVSVAASEAFVDNWRETIDAVGTIRATRGILLNAETAGDITRVHVTSGEQVVLGQPLISIDERVEVATRQRIAANLKLAQLIYDRDASLIKQKSIPQTQLDTSRADLEAAQAELAEIDAILENKRIVAPFAGTLGILQVRLGDYVEASDPLVTLQDLSSLEVDFSVPDRHTPRLRAGLDLKLRTTAFPDTVFRATLQAVDARVDEATRNLLLRAVVHDGDGLLPGMFARLSIDLNSEVARVFVPETAVTYSLQGDTIYLIEDDGKGLIVNPRVVTTAGVRGGQVAIASGLEPGERVVTVGQNKLYRGARVQIVDSSGNALK